MSKYPGIFLAAGFVLLASAATAQAQVIAYDAPLQSGNQSWSGPLGMDFNVTSPIQVQSVGIFDSNGDGFNGTLQAAIFNRQTGAVVPGTSVTFTSAAPGVLINAHRFIALAPAVSLPAGEYSIVATGFTGSDPNGNTMGSGAMVKTQNSGGGLITFVGTSRYDYAAGLYLPQIPDAEMVRYLAGSFQFSANGSNGSPGLPAGTRTLDGPFQTRYVANLHVIDSLINITNTGSNGAMPWGPGIGPQAGNICVNVYAFSPDEQMIGCCSCHITPNGLASLSVFNDIRTMTLTGVTPNSMMIKLVATATGGTPAAPTYTGGVSACSQSAAGLNLTHPIAPAGMAAWATTGHMHGLYPVPAAPPPFAITETPFTPATLSAGEITSLNNRCTAIIGNAGGFGQCRSCSLGGRGAVRE